MTRLSTSRRLGACLALTTALATAASGLVAAAPTAGAATTAAAAPGDAYPTSFALPDGFQPEGIAIGPNEKAYFGSRLDGDIFKVNLRNGKGKVISQGPGKPSVGLKADVGGRLFVSGGTAGNARVVDGRTGEILKRYRLAGDEASFINDVVLTDGAAYFTDSLNARLFVLPLGADGALPKRDEVETLELGGSWVQNPGVNNANGIATTPDGKRLLVVNSSTGQLFKVNPRNGRARIVDLGDTTLTNGDGLLLDGRTLYAVQNRLNQVAVLTLSKDATSARLAKVLTSPLFDVPTTVAKLRNRLYLPNARFSTPPTPTTTYSVTQVRA